MRTPPLCALPSSLSHAPTANAVHWPIFSFLSLKATETIRKTKTGKRQTNHGKETEKERSFHTFFLVKPNLKCYEWCIWHIHWVQRVEQRSPLRFQPPSSDHRRVFGVNVTRRFLDIRAVMSWVCQSTTPSLNLDCQDFWPVCVCVWFVLVIGIKIVSF